MSGILVVDDDPELRRYLVTALLGSGCEVESAASGSGALDLVRLSPFDAIVSGVQMSAADGLSLLRSIREFDLDVPVVLVTENPMLESAIQAVEYGGHLD